MIRSPENPQLQLGLDAASENGSSQVVHNLLRLWQIAQQRKNTIVRCVCLAVLLSSVYYALAPRYYTSTAKLLIIQRNTDVANVGEQPGQENLMVTHREIVISPVVIQEAIDSLLPEHRIDFQDSPPSDWGRIVARNLSARTTRKANFIEVSYHSLSPDASAAVVSAVVQAYLGFVDRTHKSSAAEAITVLTQKSDELAANMDAKKKELQSLRERVGSLAVKSDGTVVDPVIERALKLNDALVDAQQHRLKLEASLAAIGRAILNHEDVGQYLIELEDVVGQQVLMSALALTPQDLVLVKDQEQKLLDIQAEIARIAPFYGTAHPKVHELQQQAQAVQQFLAGYQNQTSQRMAGLGGSDFGPLLQKMLTQSLVQARQQENQLQLAFDAQKGMAQAQSEDLQKMHDMDREIERLESEYDNLVQKITSFDMFQLQAPIQATVVQEPLPDDVPTSPQLRIVGLLALVGGLFVGGAIAYVQDVLDERFPSPEEMSAQLGVPVLSMVRRLKKIDGEGLATIHTFIAPNAVESEAFRTLRTALTLSAGATDRIAVSSAEPGDGKTTIAANLAVSFAQAGKKTLIIDADLRKPGMTALMGCKGQPGIADILCSDEPMASAASSLTHHTDLPELDVLSAGLRRPNPAELLGGPRFAELLAWAEANYDQVIVDCPPVLAVSDAQIIGRLVDGAIMVVQPHKNNRRLVARAVQMFAGTGSVMLGIVANGLSQRGGYGYAAGYGYGYAYGYGHDTLDQQSKSATTNGPERSHRLRIAA